MAPRFVVCLLLAGCVPAGAAPQYPGEFAWTYDNGVVSAGHRRQNPQPFDTPYPAALLATSGPARGAVRFCVGPTGSVTSANTETSTGDPELDRALRDTVRTWTFQPAEFGGLRVEGCSTAVFAKFD